MKPATKALIAMSIIWAFATLILVAGWVIIFRKHKQFTFEFNPDYPRCKRKHHKKKREKTLDRILDNKKEEDKDKKKEKKEAKKKEKEKEKEKERKKKG